MTTNNSSNSQFTRVGFNKKGFGCCGHWQICHLGKLDCYYETIDPEVSTYCSSYQRYHKKATQVVDVTPQVVQQQSMELPAEETLDNNKELVQLSLF